MVIKAPCNKDVEKERSVRLRRLKLSLFSLFLNKAEDVHVLRCVLREFT